MPSSSRPQLLLLLLACLTICSGCPDKPDPDAKPNGTAENGKPRASQHCEENLTNAFSSLDPRRLEISADVESTLNVLNDWLVGCSGTDLAVTELAPELAARLDESQREHVQHERFFSRDAGYLRNCLLTRDISAAIARPNQSDLERSVAAFNFVVQNVLLTADSRNLPLTVNELLVFGKGTAAQQAWVTAEILRQYRIDSVLLAGPDEKLLADGDFLFAVLIDGEAYLFDFSIGSPVPVPGTTTPAIVSQPATLTQLRENPTAIDALRGVGSRIPTAELLQQPTVYVPIDCTAWSRRMQILQNVLVGDRACHIAEPTPGAETSRDFLARVTAVKNGGWTAEDVRIWSFPNQQSVAYWELDEDLNLSQSLSLRRLPMQAPVEYQSYDEARKVPILSPPANKQWKLRIEQLLGNAKDAIPGFGLVRMGPADIRRLMQSIPPEARTSGEFATFEKMHEWAADDAHFWIGAMQLTRGDAADAAATFADYEHVHPNGRWVDAAAWLWARALIRREQFGPAVQKLNSIPETSPLKPGAAFLISRLPELPAESPAEPAKETATGETDKESQN